MEKKKRNSLYGTMTFKDSAYSYQHYFYVIDAFLTCTHMKSETYIHKPIFIHTRKYTLHIGTDTHSHTHTPFDSSFTE